MDYYPSPSASFPSHRFTDCLVWEAYCFSISGEKLIVRGVVNGGLMMATVRNGFLWTCQTVGLSGTNGTYTGDASGTNVDRSAIQWLAFEISPDATTLTLFDHGRVFDPSAT